jgi:hypothetical protein
MDSPAEIEICSAHPVYADVILQMPGGGLRFTRHGICRHCSIPETVQIRLHQIHVLVATVAGDVVGTVSGVMPEKVVCAGGQSYPSGAVWVLPRVTRCHRNLAGFPRMQTDHAGHNFTAESRREVLREKRIPSFGPHRGFSRDASARIRSLSLPA